MRTLLSRRGTISPEIQFSSRKNLNLNQGAAINAAKTAAHAYLSTTTKIISK
jgi:hypothetical protein